MLFVLEYISFRKGDYCYLLLQPKIALVCAVIFLFLLGVVIIWQLIKTEKIRMKLKTILKRQ